MAYSIDFRRKVLDIKECDGLSFEKTALRFGISESSRFRQSKCLELCQTRNKLTTKIDMAVLARDVEQEPDTFQLERFGCGWRGVGEALIFYPKAYEKARYDD